MTFVLFANTVSPHQLPLARKLARRFGAEGFRYVYTEALSDERKKLGWSETSEAWIIPYSDDRARRWLYEADVVLMQHNRDWKLMENRLRRGKCCIYSSERWFKPSLGMLRLLWPRYFRMAMRFVRLLESYENLTYFPQGIHAARDMARLCGLMHGDWRCLFDAPRLEFERQPCGRVFLAGNDTAKSAKRYSLDKMRMWGYFVEEGKGENCMGGECQGKDVPNSLRVLWVGRLLRLKRVDTIIHAIGKAAWLAAQSHCRVFTLDIYGTGPEEQRLKNIAARYGDTIKFHPPVSIGEVRKLMREHDVYVLASNGYEGWGAVVNEALAEGMQCLGTYEAGSSATILPKERLFHSEDWMTLAELLGEVENLPSVDFARWTTQAATENLTAIIQEFVC